MIWEKYEISGMNTLKVIKTRSIPGVDDIETLDHKISPKGITLSSLQIYNPCLVVEKIYNLFKRLIESYNENTQKIEIHYSTVISDKEVIIGELCDQ